MVLKAAIVTGPTGQDGAYLTEFLLDTGYDVKCLIRRCTYPLSSSNLKVKSDSLKIYEGDVLDQPIIHKMIQDCEGYERVEIYNLAAQSHVGVSFNCPKYTFEANTLGILNILETVRQHKNPEKFRVYQASTSEMYKRKQLHSTLVQCMVFLRWLLIG
jgi:GDPmannose 4,6-dehydratase